MAVKKGLKININSENCVGCRLCQMRCSFRFTKRFSFSDARIDIDWNEEQCRYDVSLNEECDRCGLCVDSCVYGTLTLEKEGAKEGGAR
jgi:formate hydrogenlyase subunit 6/NADH:ubiquinone oxidoreductase subunit I